jgi:hypothetical protein
MRALKIDLSGYEGEQRKAMSTGLQLKSFSLGYVWSPGCLNIIHEYEPYLYFNDGGDGLINYGELGPSFKYSPCQEISPTDFLLLEPEQKDQEKTDYNNSTLETLSNFLNSLIPVTEEDSVFLELHGLDSRYTQGVLFGYTVIRDFMKYLSESRK